MPEFVKFRCTHPAGTESGLAEPHQLISAKKSLFTDKKHQNFPHARAARARSPRFVFGLRHEARGGWVAGWLAR